MISIKLICVGKLKEDYLKAAEAEYLKRLNRFCKLEIIEIQDEKVPTEKIGGIDMNNIRVKETTKIIEKINKIGKSSIFVLDLKGAQYTSEEFSDLINKTTTYENSTLVFVIGGSLGLSEDIDNLKHTKLCFSKLTFPHQLIRIFLLEQVFRGFKILNKEAYHH